MVFEGNTPGEGGGVGPVQDILAEGNVLDAAVISEGGFSQGCYGIGNGEGCETILGEGFFADGDYGGVKGDAGEFAAEIGPIGDGIYRMGNIQGFTGDFTLRIPGDGDDGAVGCAGYLTLYPTPGGGGGGGQLGSRRTRATGRSERTAPGGRIRPFGRRGY